jgi:hypothetical protein
VDTTFLGVIVFSFFVIETDVTSLSVLLMGAVVAMAVELPMVVSSMTLLVVVERVVIVVVL